MAPWRLFGFEAHFYHRAVAAALFHGRLGHWVWRTADLQAGAGVACCACYLKVKQQVKLAAANKHFICAFENVALRLKCPMPSHRLRAKHSECHNECGLLCPPRAEPYSKVGLTGKEVDSGSPISFKSRDGWPKRKDECEKTETTDRCGNLWSPLL